MSVQRVFDVQTILASSEPSLEYIKQYGYQLSPPSSYPIIDLTILTQPPPSSTEEAPMASPCVLSNAIESCSGELTSSTEEKTREEEIREERRRRRAMMNGAANADKKEKEKGKKKKEKNGEGKEDALKIRKKPSSSSKSKSSARSSMSLASPKREKGEAIYDESSAAPSTLSLGSFSWSLSPLHSFPSPTSIRSTSSMSSSQSSSSSSSSCYSSRVSTLTLDRNMNLLVIPPPNPNLMAHLYQSPLGTSAVPLTSTSSLITSSSTSVSPSSPKSTLPRPPCLKKRPTPTSSMQYTNYMDRQTAYGSHQAWYQCVNEGTASAPPTVTVPALCHSFPSTTFPKCQKKYVQFNLFLNQTQTVHRYSHRRVYRHDHDDGCMLGCWGVFARPCKAFVKRSRHGAQGHPAMARQPTACPCECQEQPRERRWLSWFRERPSKKSACCCSEKEKKDDDGPTKAQEGGEGITLTTAWTSVVNDKDGSMHQELEEMKRNAKIKKSAYLSTASTSDSETITSMEKVHPQDPLYQQTEIVVEKKEQQDPMTRTAVKDVIDDGKHNENKRKWWKRLMAWQKE